MLDTNHGFHPTSALILPVMIMTFYAAYILLLHQEFNLVNHLLNPLTHPLEDSHVKPFFLVFRSMLLQE